MPHSNTPTPGTPLDENEVIQGTEAAPAGEHDIAEGHDDMAALYNDSFRQFAEGEIIKGTIIQLREKEVVVDVGFKSEGIIPIEEFRDERGAITAKIGDTVEVFLEETENSDGYVVLSKEKADKAKVWEELARVHQEDGEVEGRVIERVKGGLSVDIGVRAFLPGSQIDIRPVHNLETVVGQRIRVKILKINRMRNNVVVSRRVILEKEMEGKRAETLGKLIVGAVMKGTVKNITEYGAFVDLGGVDGLLHITDMSWGRISHPSEMLMVGDKIEVMILEFDPRDPQGVPGPKAEDGRSLEGHRRASTRWAPRSRGRSSPSPTTAPSSSWKRASRG